MKFNKRKIVSFKNKSNNTLYGIIHSPIKEIDLTEGVIILNPGTKNKVAPHRLNIKIERMLVSMGYHVFRFDPTGIGDSGGFIIGETISGIWRQIQKGLFVDDTLLAIEYFKSKCQLKSITLIGSCGGAITSILSTKSSNAIKQIFLIDVPINLDEDAKRVSDEINSVYSANKSLSKYSKKVINYRSMLRFFLGRSDYSTIFKSLFIKANQLNPIKLIKTKEGFNPKFNYLFLDAFETVIKKTKVKMMFIIAENDPGKGIFYEDFYEKFLLRHKQLLSKIKIVEIKNANHIYSHEQSQKDLINLITKYISEFPA